MTWEENYLAHYGIKGQQWGVRRFQNEDRSLTPEGKERYGMTPEKAVTKKAYAEFDKKVKSGEFTNDPEIRELYAMERVEKIRQYPKACSNKEKILMARIDSGEKISDKELNLLRKSGRDHADRNLKLRQRMLDINKNKSSDELSSEDKKELDDIFSQMSDNRKAHADIVYTVAKADVNKYADQIAKETDHRYIDPSYRSFSSKDDKAKAEAEYLKNMWTGSIDENNANKIRRERLHLFCRVDLMSMDGYKGIPRSDRNKELFDYVDTWDPFDTYHNWKPKYEKTSEWKELQNKRDQIANETGYKKAEKEYFDRPAKEALTARQNDKLWDAYVKARKKYDNIVEKNGIKISEKKIKKNFEQKLMKNTLLDLGYEVTPDNLKYIENIVPYILF